MLADLGYENVTDFTGGKQTWVDAGLPLESDDPCDPEGACVEEPE